MEEYYKLLDAVEQYYGAGSDQWVQIAQYGLNADDAATILRQTPGVSTTVSNSGRILSYTVDNTVSLATQNAGSVINSNAQLPALSRTTTVSVPSEMVVDSTGKVVAESGLKTVSTGSKVAATVSKVAIGVAAASAALQLGAAIDGALYNINPDFWDEHNMKALDPTTWDNYITNDMGKNFFNMVFGINKSNNSTQAYMDQNVLAYMAAYMARQGAFNFEPSAPPLENNIIFSYGTSSEYPIDMSKYNSVLKNYDLYYIGPSGDQGGYATTLTIKYNNVTYNIPYSGSVIVGYLNRSGSDIYLHFATDVTAMKPYLNNYGTSSYWDVRFAFANAMGNEMLVSYGNIYKSVYNGVDKLSVHSTLSVPRSQSPNTFNHYASLVNSSDVAGGDWAAYAVFTALYNLVPGGGVEGITKQDGATLPTGITPQMSVADVLAYLQSTYPDLFNNAITNDVVQDDGSIQRYTYVPVPIPDDVTFNNVTEVLEPIGGENQNQQNKVVTPDVPQSVVDTLLELITATNPDNPTETPTEIPDEDIPDTGDGDTPSIIIPPGSAQALYSIYNPSQAELNSFGSWLWSSDFVDQLLKIFNDPMQAIIGLHKVFATPSVSGTGTIKVGYLNSGVSSNIVGNQYTSIDCGTVNLYEYFGNALDYLNTDIYLYLPFVGIVPVNTDDVMRGAINVSYKVDVLTGACLCSVNVTRDLHGGQLYTYSGNCAVQYPLSSGSYMGIVSGLLSIAGSVAGTIATGGAALPFALGTGASAINSLRTHVEHSGNIGGNSGAMGIKKPYFIIRRPQTAMANNFKSFNGQSQNKYVTLSSCSDYVRVKYVNLENITGATGEELTLIENELTKGVLI